MLNATFFSTLGYRTLTAMFRFFRLFWVLFPIHSLTLSICICLILGQFFSQILVCTATNICLRAIGRLMFLVKCEQIGFCKADKCINVTQAEGQTNKNLWHLVQFFSQFLVFANTNISLHFECSTQGFPIAGLGIQTGESTN